MDGGTSGSADDVETKTNPGGANIRYPADTLPRRD
jgi:hypothetical protein